MSFVCVEIPAPLNPADFEITLPGGIAVKPSVNPLQVRRASDLAMSVLAQAQPALAAFQPVLDIIGVLEALTTCITSIPEAIATLDPTKITACVSGLNTAMGKIVQYVPQLALPLSAFKMLGLVIVILEDLRAILVDLQTATGQANAALALAQERNDEQLISIANCALRNIDAERQRAVTVFDMIGAPIRIVNIVLRILNQPCISLTVDSSLDLEALIRLIDAILGFLRTINIPIPQFPSGPIPCSKYMVYNPETGLIEEQAG